MARTCARQARVSAAHKNPVPSKRAERTSGDEQLESHPHAENVARSTRPRPPSIGASPCLAVQVAVPVVLDGVVGAARQELGDRRPSVAILGMLLHDLLLLQMLSLQLYSRVRRYTTVPRSAAGQPAYAAILWSIGACGSRRLYSTSSGLKGSFFRAGFSWLNHLRQCGWIGTAFTGGCGVRASIPTRHAAFSQAGEGRIGGLPQPTAFAVPRGVSSERLRGDTQCIEVTLNRASALWCRYSFYVPSVLELLSAGRWREYRRCTRVHHAPPQSPTSLRRRSR